MNMKRALRQAVSSVSKSYKQKPMKPSLARVAVSAFYDKLEHQFAQCKSYRKPHTLHLLYGDVATACRCAALPVQKHR